MFSKDRRKHKLTIRQFSSIHIFIGILLLNSAQFSLVISSGSVSNSLFEGDPVDVIVTVSENVDFSTRFPQAQVHHRYTVMPSSSA